MDIYRDKYAIMVLTGPLQSAKTTFLKTQFENYSYVNLENNDSRNHLTKDILNKSKHNLKRLLMAIKLMPKDKDAVIFRI